MFNYESREWHERGREGIREEGLEEMAGRHNLQPVGGFPLRIARAGRGDGACPKLSIASLKKLAIM